MTMKPSLTRCEPSASDLLLSRFHALASHFRVVCIHCGRLFINACMAVDVKVFPLVQVIMKSAAEESTEKRIRRCWLASALVAFSQGIAFFHAGDEILRSKSLDRDSYNSGAFLI